MMRYYLAVLFLSSFSVLLVASLSAEETIYRQKRSLRSDFWPSLPDSFMRLGDYARELTDQISAQASMAVQHIIPDASKTVGGMSPQGIREREEEVKSEPRKKGLIRVPIGRETEGDEKEIEMFDPVKTRPQRPTSGGNGGLHPFIPFSFSFGVLTPWWEGPNVCVERNEVEESEKEPSGFPGFNINFETTSCVPSETAYVCTKKIQTNGMRKTIVVSRQCCHGYVRRADGRSGCSALKMENLLDTLKTLEMRKFLQWIENSDFRSKLADGNYTIFAPSNEAITDFEDETEDNEISAIDPVKRLTDVSSVVLSHIIDGFVNMDTLENEQILNTENEQSKIRFNKYNSAHEVITANCVPISGKNNFATNGIIHLTSAVLPQASKTVGEIIENDGQFSIFVKLLKDSGLFDELKEEQQPWTLFAPTDEAFKKLPKVLRKQIESGEACVQSILHQHLVKSTICSSAVVSQVRVKNILENKLHLTRDESEKLRVDGALIDSVDNMGTNGVIHAIDKVLIPSQARSLLKALEEEERTDLLDLIESAELISTLEDMENFTFLLPSREAISNLPNETMQKMEQDPEFVKKLLMSHLILSHTPTKMFKDNMKLKTLHGHDIHLKLHEVFPGLVTGATVQCAFIVDHDNQVCGAIIHKINRVLMPPKGSIVETLKNMENHDIVLKLLQNTDLETKLEDAGPYTFLAPTNDAFERMTELTLDELLENKTKAEEILMLHILPESLCCNSISHASPFHRQYVRTYDGSMLPLHRGFNDRVRFGRARALQCDISTTNGLIHSINRVILPHRPTTHMFGMDFWPFY